MRVRVGARVRVRVSVLRVEYYDVKHATTLTLTTLTLSRWAPEEWLQWSLGEMDDGGGGSL